MRWSFLAVVSLLTVVVLTAAPVALADRRGGTDPGGNSVGSLALPRAELPPEISLPQHASEISGANRLDHGLPSLAPEVGRLRLKQFVADAYARSPQRLANAGDPPPLDTLLAQIDGLTPDQVHDLDARLAPVIWATRALASRDSAATGNAVTEELFPAQATDPEVLRQDLAAYLTRLEPYAPMAQANAALYTRLVTEMRQSVQSMTAEELSNLQELFSSVPSARAVLDIDPATILGSPPPGGSSGSAAGVADIAGPTGLQAGSIHTNSSCADMAFGPVATAVLTVIGNTAADIANLLSDDYMATTFNIKDIPQLIAKGIALPLQLLALAAQTDVTYFVNCNEGAHQVLFSEHDAEMTNRTAAMASLLDDSSKQSDLKRILANRMDRLDTFNAENRRLTLRLAIEKDLLRQGDPRIALFQLPASVCVTAGEHQSCGQLETVRDIVADTILMNRSAGFDTTLASTALQDGDDQRALGLYKAAYTRYRYAYQLAVRSAN